MPLTFKTGKTIDQLLADERGWLDSLRRGDEVECDFRSGAGPEIGTITRVHGERTFTVQFRSGATVVEYDFVDGRMPNYTHRISPVRAVVK